MNYFAYDAGVNIADIRIWRNAKKETQTLDATGPCCSNASQSSTNKSTSPFLSFSQLYDEFSITNREVQITDLVMLGQFGEEICGTLNIDKPTLRTHMRALLSKTGMKRRAQFSQFLITRQHPH